MSEPTSVSSQLPPSLPPTGGTGQTPPPRVSATRQVSVPPAEAEHPTSERPVVERQGTERAEEPRPSESSKPKQKPPGPRRVRLAISRVDPWSVMKLSFLLSIAVGIGIVVAAALVWTVLNQMEVFAEIRSVIEDAGALNQFGKILEYFEFSRVLSVATVIAVVDVVLMTALATLGAFIYNLVAAMVGGLHLTLTDD